MKFGCKPLLKRRGCVAGFLRASRATWAQTGDGMRGTHPAGPPRLAGCAPIQGPSRVRGQRLRERNAVGFASRRECTSPHLVAVHMCAACFKREGWPPATAAHRSAPQLATAAFGERIWRAFSEAAVKTPVEILDGKDQATCPQYLAYLVMLPQYHD